ncbi:MAG: hypothetical protein ACREF0_09225, partial [Acetobacteraceae bacterium]
VDHHHDTNIDVGMVDSAGMQQDPGQDRHENPAMEVRDPISRGGAGGAVTGWEIPGLEGWNRAVAEADDFAGRRVPEAPGVDQLKIRAR